MTEFWESSFRSKHTMWGFEPAGSATQTADFFHKQGFHKVLIPGFGYGRNARAFIDKGLQVTGIEISETAISLAKEHFGAGLNIYHGAVSAMPFDQQHYDGIFCYALIHLLDEQERMKLIQDCYRQLNSGGYMVFVAISKSTPTYGEGTALSSSRFETKHGVKLFYYDAESVHREFGNYGLIQAKEINEPAQNNELKPSQIFWQITCKKELATSIL